MSLENKVSQEIQQNVYNNVYNIENFDIAEMKNASHADVELFNRNFFRKDEGETAAKDFFNKSDESLTDSKVIDPKVADPKNVEAKNVETKLAAQQNMDQKLTDAKDLDPKTFEAKLTDSKVNDPKLADPKTFEAKLAAQQNNDKKNVLPSPETLLQSLFPTSVNAPQEIVNNVEANPLTKTDIIDLVDRILVSESSAKESAVKLSISSGALKGSEITISRLATGSLQVDISCSNYAAFQTAVAGQQDLKDALNKFGDVEVKVGNSADAETSNHGDSQKRSRGYENLAYSDQ
ncbi:MAG: hypothetical protein IJT59_03495 [Desulfovibrionaceae bacterium]|nr:hypothetical protein [Desulfovibrionaceae bacterium]